MINEAIDRTEDNPTDRRSFLKKVFLGGASAALALAAAKATLAKTVISDEYISIPEIRAFDANGLKLYDDGGNGIFVADGGYVGIGTNSPYAHLHIGNDAVDTTTNFYGVRNDHTKTAGVTTEADDMYGMFNRIIYNHSGSVGGHLRGLYTHAQLDAGTIGDGNENIDGIYCRADMNGGTASCDIKAVTAMTDVNAGTITDDVMGMYTYVDVESAVTSIGGDVVGHYIWMDVDKAPVGSVYMLYLRGYSGIDYGIYEVNSAPNYFAGNIGVGVTAPTRPISVSGDGIHFTPQSAPPSSPMEGDAYFDSDDHRLKVYNGTTWANCN